MSKDNTVELSGANFREMVIDDPYPTCRKLAQAQKLWGALYEFFDWAQEEHKLLLCSVEDGYERLLVDKTVNWESLFAEYIGVDERVFEDERRNIL